MKLPRALLLVALLPACATLPEPSGGGDDLPNAGAGPFRDLVTTELSTSLDLVAPYGIDDGNTYGRDIAVLAGGTPAEPLAVVGCVAAAQGTNATPATPTSAIVCYQAADGRSFDWRSPLRVLEADAPWEGGEIATPAMVWVHGLTFLYYAAKGGIGLATDQDIVFAKVGGPVLGPAAPDSWEHGATPASPGVVALPDGSFRMFYEVAVGGGATAIGEASSPDGRTWTRLGTGPALAASGGGDAGPTPWDATSVGSPFPELVTSAVGRTILRLYYGATDASGARTIALAARYGTDGAFSRAATPVYGSGGTLGAREPCVVCFPGVALLYATESDSTIGGHAAIAVGVAPGTAVLPPPDPM